MNPDLSKLTHTEKRVLQLVAADFPPNEIGESLGITVRTVAVHKHNIRKKLGVKTDVGLYRAFYHIPAHSTDP